MLYFLKTLPKCNQTKKYFSRRPRVVFCTRLDVYSLLYLKYFKQRKSVKLTTTCAELAELAEFHNEFQLLSKLSRFNAIAPCPSRVQQ